MKIYRLLSIINIMLNKELVSAKYLAEKHEVSVKTIQRDMETLNMAGIPVFSMKGMKGGYGILDSYKYDTKLLSPKEVNLFKSMLDSLNSVYSNKSLESLLEKLESAVITSASTEFSKVKVDITPWNKDEKLHEKINLISDAIEQSRILSIEYYNSNGECLLREIEPYELVLRHGRWYLLSYCLEKKDVRTFKVNRVSTMEITNRHFDLRDYKSIKRDDSTMRDGVKKVLRFNKEVYYRVVDIFNDDEVTEITEKNVTVVTYLELDSWLIPVILSFGDDVKVIEPEILKENVKKEIEKMNKIYN
ncbi:MAG: YafY family transcriptional regulator [Clostridiales bacterium]|nr:YafY family transcriptional regulator [Clostridiales bacterium]